MVALTNWFVGQRTDVVRTGALADGCIALTDCHRGTDKLILKMADESSDGRLGVRTDQCTGRTDRTINESTDRTICRRNGWPTKKG
jgi:hypothetical protein